MLIWGRPAMKVGTKQMTLICGLVGECLAKMTKRVWVWSDKCLRHHQYLFWVWVPWYNKFCNPQHRNLSQYLSVGSGLCVWFLFIYELSFLLVQYLMWSALLWAVYLPNLSLFHDILLIFLLFKTKVFNIEISLSFVAAP